MKKLVFDAVAVCESKLWLFFYLEYTFLFVVAASVHSSCLFLYLEFLDYLLQLVEIQMNKFDQSFQFQDQWNDVLIVF
jgi:hypothetical protein